MRSFAWTLAVVVGACSAPERGRVLLIGLDGATLDLAAPLMAEGRLPHLAELAAEGAMGPLESQRPLLSPRIWTSIATGKTPDRHGIANWVYEGDDGQVHLYESAQRRAAALWNIASEAGQSVVTVNWLITYPPEVVRGVVVTDHALPEEARRRREFSDDWANLAFGRGLDDAGTEAAPVVFPNAWHERLWPLLTSVTPLTHPNPFDSHQGLNGVALQLELSHFYWNDQRATATALALEEALHPDLLMVLLQGTDRVSHSLWGTLRPETAPQLSEEKRRIGARALRDYYAIADSLVGELMARYGPRDLVVVVSDHGFEHVPGRGTTPWGGVHESDDALHGIFVARGPGVPRRHEVQDLSVLDVTPTILTWLGLPVARDMGGRAAAFLAREPSFTESYDGIAIQRIESRASYAEPEILRQLEALGYLEAK